ncbi:MAG TPA: hypothetical protein PLX90_05305, partial [Anaerolineales bacterium]|nr:hypothetical protein [Anaerolineales bacterium]
DIFKVLVNSRQPNYQSQQQNADPMAELIGSLLGGGQPSTPQRYSQQQQQGQSGGLGDMMGLLEMFMGGNQQQSNSMNQMGMNNPIMMLLQPFVDKLAKKMNIPPQIAMMVVSFVVYKLLAHHPTSGRDSNSFDLDDMFKQMSKGKIDPNILQNSGMINELSRQTGLDQATAAKSLETAFGMFGKPVKAGMTPSRGVSRTTTTTRKSPVSGNKLRTARVKGGAVKRRG